MTATLTPPAASAELLRRRAARERLMPFAQYVHPGYEAANHLCLLAEHLEAVERREITRLIVSMPPQNGKSLLVSSIWPCWYLGKNPIHRIIQTGYGWKIAVRNSRFARNYFVSDGMSVLFPRVRYKPQRASQERIQYERQAADEWGTVQGGQYIAAGLRGSITGFGADVIIIDDPLRNREEANSPTIRERNLDAFRSVLRTRLAPNGAIVIVMTRWSPDDLAGSRIQEMNEGGTEWVTLSLPAINENGKALWPNRYPIEELDNIRSEINPYEWSAQYMQEPVLRGGNRFMVDGGRVIIHDSPEDFPDCRYVRFWDLASSEKERSKSDPDWTSGALVGVTKDGPIPHVWIPDIIRKQAEAPERDRSIIAAAKFDGPAVKVAIESVAGYKDTYTWMKKLLTGISTVKKVTVSKDKTVRAAPLEPVFEAGNVHILRAPWNRPFKDEFRGFPDGKHDDIVDAVAGAYAELHKPEPVFIDRKRLGI